MAADRQVGKAELRHLEKICRINRVREDQGLHVCAHGYSFERDHYKYAGALRANERGRDKERGGGGGGEGREQRQTNII